MKIKYNPGIIANDEGLRNLCKKYSLPVGNKSYKKIYDFRNFIFSNKLLSKNIYGVILHSDDFQNLEGLNLIKNLKKNNIKIGIKFDLGRKFVSKKKLEKVSYGLNEINKKILIYKKFNCSFAKWKAEFNVYKNTVSTKNINDNINILMNFIFICEKNKILPMIETDLVRNSRYNLKVAKNISKKIYDYLNQCLKQKKFNTNILFKTNIIYPGYGHQFNHKISSNLTNNFISNKLPKNIKKVFFLSGGEKDHRVIKTIKILYKEKNKQYSFAFGRGFFEKLDNFFLNFDKTKLNRMIENKIRSYKN